MAKAGVLLVDDEQMIRLGIGTIINHEPDMEVMGEAADGATAIAEVRRLRPDIVLMDVRMPGMDGIAATRRILETEERPPKIIVVTTFSNDDYVYDALRAGASGFLIKRASPDEIVQAVRTVLAGDSLLYPDAIRQLAARNPPSGGGSGQPDGDGLAWARLTGREADVLRGIAAGLDNDEIAARLVVSVQTVKTHVSNVLAKLGVRGRTQAAVMAFDSGFVKPAWSGPDGR